MTTEKFVRRSKLIAEHLSEIAFHTDQVEQDGMVHPVNPAFREVVTAQERLLNAVERLLEKLPGRRGKQKP
jgi:hypothetical protein